MKKSAFSPGRTPLLSVFLQTAALSALAIAQPLLQLLRENPEFLTVHQSRGSDVLILSAVLLLLPPLILTAIVFLSGLLGLQHRTVRQCMVPRESMVTVNRDWSVSRTARVLSDYPYARVPVSGQDRADVVGLVHTKDLVLLLHSHQ